MGGTVRGLSGDAAVPRGPRQPPASGPFWLAPDGVRLQLDAWEVAALAGTARRCLRDRPGLLAVPLLALELGTDPFVDRVLPFEAVLVWRAGLVELALALADDLSVELDEDGLAHAAVLAVDSPTQAGARALLWIAALTASAQAAAETGRVSF